MLNGVNVVEFTTAFAGPLVGHYFNHLGAHVTKIEPPWHDMSRDWGYYATYLNHGKDVIQIDLRHNTSYAKDIVKRADIIIENNAPGMMEKFGLSFEDVRKINPFIVYTSIKGYDAFDNRKAMDLNIQAESGLLINGQFSASVVDYSTGLNAMIASVAALREKKARYIQIPMNLVALSISQPILSNMLNSGYSEIDDLHYHPYLSMYGCFPASDNRVCFACPSDKLFKKCATILGISTEQQDEYPTNSDRLSMKFIKLVEDMTKRQTAHYWIERFRYQNIPSAFIKSKKEVIEWLNAHEDLLIELPNGVKTIRNPILEMTPAECTIP